MARPLRLELADGWYHVTGRGNERKAVFRDDMDRSRFLALLGEIERRYGIEVHGYVLMGNHYHLLLRLQGETGLSAGMQWLLVSYTVWFNRRHRPGKRGKRGQATNLDRKEKERQNEKEMARSIRIEFEGAYYHVMARGNRREAIYLDEEDRKFFLKTLGEACGKMGWRVHGWVLMGNHYHLMIETPEANLVKGMQWLQNTYTRRFNTRHGLWGRVFGDRYKSVIVQGEGYYYETLLDYLHLNPVRAGLIDVRKGQSVMDYPWSSVGGGLPPARRPAWLASERVLAAFGFSDTAAGRQGFVERLDHRAREEEWERCGSPEVPEGWDARFSHLRRGWYWGSQEFSQHLQKLAGERLNTKGHRTYQGALASKDHGEREARRLKAEGLAAAELKEADLEQLPGSDPRKVAVARCVWERTSVDLNWIAESFHMRSPANASQQIRRQREKTPLLPQALEEWLIQSRFVA